VAQIAEARHSGGMKEMITSVLFVIAVVVVVIVLPLLGLARLRRASRVKEDARKAEFERRRLHPDYAAFKSHFGCEPPLAIRQLYENRETILDGDFNIRLPLSRRPWPVAWFEAMEDGSWPDIEGFYAFANDGCGNLYLVTPQDADPEVIFLDHETGQRESLGISLSQFLAAKRIR
jgi:hypothetical protein